MESLQSNMNEGWRGLCELAIREDDPKKFHAILTELNRLLEEREQLIPSHREPTYGEEIH